MQRSERLQAVLQTKYFSYYLHDARQELQGMRTLTYLNIEKYINIISKSLIETTEVHHDDILDFGGRQRKNMKFTVGTYIDTIKFVLLPELLTYYIMERDGTSYKDASTRLYADMGFPTTHHTNKLINVRVLYVSTIIS